MSINIPQYYKTHFEEQGKTILDVQKNQLDGREVSRFKDNTNMKNNSQKDNVINTQDLVLPDTKPFLDSNQPYSTSNKIKVLNQNEEPLAYYNFEDLVNNMKGISKEQKSSMRNAIITSTESMDNGQMNSSTYGLRINQTNLELKYISNRVVPKEYQEQFNALVDQYTKGLSDKYIDLYKKDAEYMINNKNEDRTVQESWKNMGNTMLESINNGTYIFQTSSKQYELLYKQVDVTKPEMVKDQLDGVYMNILTKGNTYSGGQSKSSLSEEVKYLAEKWNLVMKELGEKDHIKIAASVNVLV